MINEELMMMFIVVGAVATGIIFWLIAKDK
jgi:hypothetical protein